MPYFVFRAEKHDSWTACMGIADGLSEGSSSVAEVTTKLPRAPQRRIHHVNSASK